MSDTGTNPENGKPVRRSVGPFGYNTIFAPDGTPYMTRFWIGRLRLHIFHSGDLDADPHDHPWDFWTFPLTPYVEEVTEAWQDYSNETYMTAKRRQVVPAWRWTFRPATHCHRVLGRFTGVVTDDFGFDHDVSAGAANKLPHRQFVPQFDSGKMITIVWRSPEYRRWGFLKHRDGRWCWQHWKEYVLGGGKDGPCQ